MDTVKIPIAGDDVKFISELHRDKFMEECKPFIVFPSMEGYCQQITTKNIILKMGDSVLHLPKGDFTRFFKVEEGDRAMSYIEEPPEFKGKIIVTRINPDNTTSLYEVCGTIEFTHDGKVTAVRYDDRPIGLIPYVDETKEK